jgi:Tol biopolymer transport system component
MRMPGMAVAVTAVCFAWPGGLGAAAEKSPAAAPAIAPVSEEEKKKLLEAETPEQKKLRAELAALKDSRIVFNANLNPGGRNALFVMNADGSEMKKLSPDDKDDSYPHISFDGRRLAFDRREIVSAEELKKLPCDPGWSFDKNIGGMFRAPTHRPNGFIWISDVDGSNAKRVAQGSYPHWAPNGKVITYVFTLVRKHKAVLLDLEKNTEKVVVPPDYRGAQGYSAFSPDGKWLLLSYGNGRGGYWPMNEGCTDRVPDRPFGLSPLTDNNCNAEFSPDGKWVAFVSDTFKFSGSWLHYMPCEPGNAKAKVVDMKLGHEQKSVNYFPDFSPCGKYLVYSHGDSQEGVKSWELASKQDLYVTRFPDCEATVRLTWTNAACQHPNWRKTGK